MFIVCLAYSEWFLCARVCACVVMRFVMILRFCDINQPLVCVLCTLTLGGLRQVFLIIANVYLHFNRSNFIGMHKKLKRNEERSLENDGRNRKRERERTKKWKKIRKKKSQRNGNTKWDIHTFGFLMLNEMRINYYVCCVECIYEHWTVSAAAYMWSHKTKDMEKLVFSQIRKPPTIRFGCSATNVLYSYAYYIHTVASQTQGRNECSDQCNSASQMYKCTASGTPSSVY